MLDTIKTALISAGLTLVSFQSQAAATSDQFGHWHYGWGWGHMFFGLLMMILFWGGIIFAIVYAIRATHSGSGHRHPSDKTSLDILNERFARGEIDQQEFEEKKKLISR
ncbi:hypothetical protein FDP08_08000 [Marinobacter panjinensis]|uniref:SHOCT domain-containing protein n=1 Tax=Marinobacter panjinensis TaxID=2576384 RepID=A0A4U6R357_9GAMM|nr:SHOCT domain-containing protein [Marinobacter panjinensis]MCR8913283.1 SHOCT domain-containing protein [Marinobacter panjinensis]TKV68040.1 hypothetical protein FDP08_08000 [Marinobacter panjinensis]